jgi:hypothetical protein
MRLPLTIALQSALVEQLSALKSECLGLVDAKLAEAHDREMVQLRIIQAAAHRSTRPPGAAASAASAAAAAAAREQRSGQ